jgi:hypothetical protein
MSDGYMSSWECSGFENFPLTAVEEPSSARLPLVRIHGSALLTIRDKLLYCSAGQRLGVLRGRRISEPEDAVCVDALLHPSKLGGLRFGDVVVPLDEDLPGTRISARRNEVYRTGGDGSLLQIFDAVAWPEISSDGSVLTLRIHCALPRFRLARFPALAVQRASNRPSSSNEEDPVVPVLADVSLSIVLCGGDTARDGEVVGFLLRSDIDKNVVEPVYMDDSVGRRAIVGAWALRETDFWTACAIFAAESAKSRNLKVGRPAKHTTGAVRRDLRSRNPLSTTAANNSNGHRAEVPCGQGQPTGVLQGRDVGRDVNFLVAQFHGMVGGTPDFIPCTVTLPSKAEAQHVVYSAKVTANTADSATLKSIELPARFVSHEPCEQALSQVPRDELKQARAQETFRTLQREVEQLRAGVRALEMVDRDSPQETRSAQHNPSYMHANDSFYGEGHRSSFCSERRTAEQGSAEKDVRTINFNRTKKVLVNETPSTSTARDPADILLTDFELPSAAVVEEPQPAADHLAQGSIVNALTVPCIIENDGSNEVENELSEGIPSRLDVFARKYLGPDYLSRFAYDHL